ncbi:MAG: hypothetical protein JRF63_11270 [Deltaproteobacteria bacterium]|nr:hypothetical protein [Deltaproteobacteria bacterium]
MNKLNCGKSLAGVTREVVLCGLALSATLLAGCSSCEAVSGFFVEPAPELEHPQTYSGAEVAFYYPGNWKATESNLSDVGVTAKIIEVESAGNAYLAVQIFTPALPLDALELLDETTRAMHAEVSRMSGGLVRSGDGITTDVTRQLLGAVRAGKRRQLTLEVLGEQVPHTIEVYAVELAQLSVVVLTTGADEDMSRLGPGYAQVLDSLQLVAN